jgi:hypothetical protein
MEDHMRNEALADLEQLIRELKTGSIHPREDSSPSLTIGKVSNLVQGTAVILRQTVHMDG